ncbi:unnamed protein product [Camellia sinensis]
MHALIVVINNASNLHGYTVRFLYRAVQTSGEQESFVQVAVWCIGEYGEMLVNNARMLDIKEPMTVSLLLQIFPDFNPGIARRCVHRLVSGSCIDGSFDCSSHIPSPELKSICKNMDGLGLRKYMIERPKVRNSIRVELSDALRGAPEAAAMVLDAMEGFYVDNQLG